MVQTGDMEASLHTRQGGVRSVPADRASQRSLSGRVQVDVAGLLPYHAAVQLQVQSQFSSVAQFCLTLDDPINCNTPGFPVHHHFLELTQIHVH